MKILWISIVTLNEMAVCQGDPYSWKILASIVLSPRESPSIFLRSQLLPLSLLPFHIANLRSSLNMKTFGNVDWPRRFSPVFLVACRFTVFILS